MLKSVSEKEISLPRKPCATWTPSSCVSGGCYDGDVPHSLYAYTSKCATEPG
ncbi:hypothetical protein BD310DRAFT_938759 [Dichomitus squalens]|uniref:Uncharacterized protein n=1 Tax=Dichomitus squalens TaxID=114155 RepID=A0A4Q9PIC6_9APHY|nr:hypothetical protein BD310DRAFT_938759 [Dichomitus squalens]